MGQSDFDAEVSDTDVRTGRKKLFVALSVLLLGAFVVGYAGAAYTPKIDNIVSMPSSPKVGCTSNTDCWPSDGCRIASQTVKCDDGSVSPEQDTGAVKDCTGCCRQSGKSKKCEAK